MSAIFPATIFIIAAAILISSPWKPASGASHHHRRCRKHYYEIVLRYEDCDDFTMTTETCAGLCTSSSEPNTAEDENGVILEPFFSACKCCMPREDHIYSTDIYLNCTFGKKLMTVPRANRCICRPCNAAAPSQGASQSAGQSVMTSQRDSDQDNTADMDDEIFTPTGNSIINNGI